MKKLIILLFISICCIGYGQDTSSKSVFSYTGNSRIEADDEVWDFGKIAENGGPVEHTFTIKNISDTPFIISNVTAACGCTTPFFSNKPIMPGETSEIKVRYDPKNRPGYFTKKIFIWTPDKGRTNVLLIKGYVLKEE